MHHPGAVTVTMVATMLLLLFAVHSTWVTSSAYSSPSVVLASQVSCVQNLSHRYPMKFGQGADGSRYIMDDFREAYYWLRQNTKEDATVTLDDR